MLKKSASDAYKIVKRGNMFMLAVGLLLGTAFGTLVNSLAKDVILTGIVTSFGVPNLDGAKAFTGINEGYILYGNFLSALVSFLIVAFFIFIMLLVWYLVVNYLAAKKAQNAPAPEPVEVKPTVDELILAELKKLNESHSSKHSKEGK
ncbi:mechanosensitive ion channel protein MscL [Mycoplasma testudineum]|nr:mechanosensitive ion channel protein MscL [Mycoplasma testudineum]